MDMKTIIIDPYYTLIVATIVLLVGRLLVHKIKFLRNFNIPEPVAGGLLAAVFIYLLYTATGISLEFNNSLQDAFMLFFFSSIGLSADFSRLKAGGRGLIIFLGVVALFIVVQNSVGVGLASALGQNPVMGLITETDYGIKGATDLGMASATFGLVLGGLIGGPIARKLVNNIGKKPITEKQSTDTVADNVVEVFENAIKQRLITSKSAIETMALFAACLSFSAIMVSPTVTAFFPERFTIPQFVWALLFGVLLRNVLTRGFSVNMFDRAIDVFGNASLSLFLGIALLNLKLWQLLDLALPMLIILAVQTFVMCSYAYFVTFRLMGSNYDAAVLSAGHCGFGMGATPTAVANMQSITERFGPSHKAFLIVPMVGAFFIDFINAFILTTFISLLQ